MESANPNPVLVEVHRGAHVESRHRGCAVAVDCSGNTVFAAGGVARAMYPRSALKWVQAIPLIESGAAARFGLSEEEIALSCASHDAEDVHTRAVTQWLQRIGHGESDLECGAEWPGSREAARDMAARGETPTRAHHNCSGKHAGMLTLAKFLGADARGYSDYAHPAQQAWLRALSELAEVDAFALDWERDGCGMPAVCLPLHNLARAFAHFAAPGKGARGAALAKIAAAAVAHPRMIAGRGRSCTDILRACGGRVLLKIGAEGVCAGAIPHLQLGFALKIDDGSGRARSVASGALLQKLGALDADSQRALSAHFCPEIVNSQGKVTGRIVAAEGW